MAKEIKAELELVVYTSSQETKSMCVVWLYR